MNDKLDFRTVTETAVILRKPARWVRMQVWKGTFPNVKRCRTNFLIPMSDIQRVMTLQGQVAEELVDDFPQNGRARARTRVGLNLDLEADDAPIVMDFSSFLVPCIYFLLDDLGRVIYVGKSTNLMARLGDHIGAGKHFARVAVRAVPFENLQDEECRFIQKYMPTLNRIGTDGRLL